MIPLDSAPPPPAPLPAAATSIACDTAPPSSAGAADRMASAPAVSTTPCRPRRHDRRRGPRRGPLRAAAHRSSAALAGHVVAPLPAAVHVGRLHRCGRHDRVRASGQGDRRGATRDRVPPPGRDAARRLDRLCDVRREPSRSGQPLPPGLIVCGRRTLVDRRVRRSARRSRRCSRRHGGYFDDPQKDVKAVAMAVGAGVVASLLVWLPFGYLAGQAQRIGAPRRVVRALVRRIRSSPRSDRRRSSSSVCTTCSRTRG